MQNKEICILGTASQVPTKKRNHVGVLLRWEDKFFLFDPGEGAQRQLIQFDLPVSRISKIFISHFHGDHCLGLPGVIQRLSLSGVEHELEIYYPASGENFLNNLLHCASFYNRLNIKKNPVQEGGQIYAGQGLQIQAGLLSHSLDCCGYRVQEPDSWTVQPHKLPPGFQGALVGRLKEQGSIEFQGRTLRLTDVAVHKPGPSMAYILDTRFCASALQLARGADLLVSEATYLESELQLAQKYGHLTASQAAELAVLAEADRLVILHFSQRYHSLAGFWQEASRIHSDLIVAKDGERVKLPERKRQLA